MAPVSRKIWLRRELEASQMEMRNGTIVGNTRIAALSGSLYSHFASSETLLRTLFENVQF